MCTHLDLQNYSFASKLSLNTLFSQFGGSCTRKKAPGKVQPSSKSAKFLFFSHTNSAGLAIYRDTSHYPQTITRASCPLNCSTLHSRLRARELLPKAAGGYNKPTPSQVDRVPQPKTLRRDKSAVSAVILLSTQCLISLPVRASSRAGNARTSPQSSPV